MDLGLKGKKAVITGGTRGIGRAIVDILAAEGCDVAFCARKEDEVKAAEQAVAATGAKAYGGTADVGDGDSIRGFIADAAAKLGGIDILIANVSAMGGGNEESAWRASVEVDIMGTMRTVEAALPFLEKAGNGAIVAISSVSGIEISADTVRSYNTVKAAVIAYMSNLAKAHAGKGIRANTVSPGTIYFEGGVWGRTKINDPARYEHFLKKNRAGRMGTPEEVARAAVFLASPAASFVSGTNLVVDGAYTNRIQF